MNLKKVIDIANKIGGITYNINTGEVNPTDGYMVSIQHTEVKCTELNDLILRGFIEANIERLSQDKYYLGLWHNDNVWHYDVAENIDDKFDAIFCGIMREQKAIWDCKNGTEIELPMPQKAGTETQKRDYAFIKSMQLAQ